MIKRTGLVALVAVAATAFAVPGAAQASSGYDRVDRHVDRAEAALERAIDLARSNPAEALAELRRNLTSTRSAERVARRVRSLRSRRAANDAVRSRSAVAGLFADNIDGYLELLTVADGGLQEFVAHVIGWSVEGRAQAIDALAGLVDDLPEAVQSRAATLLERLTSGTRSIAEDLRAAVTAGDYAAGVETALTGAFALVGGTLEDVADSLESLLPENLPAPAADAIRDALELAQGIVGQVQTFVASLVAQIPSPSGDYAPDLPALPEGISGLGNLPGLGSGSVPSIGDLLGLINHYLPGLR